MPTTAQLGILTILISALGSQAFQKKASELNLDYDIQKQPGDKYYRANIKDDDMLGMYQKWAETGMSSLMGAIANHKLKRQRKAIIQKFGECSAKATDIPKHATCLTRLLNDEIKAEVTKTIVKPGARLLKYQGRQKQNEWTSGYITENKQPGIGYNRRLKLQSEPYQSETDDHVRRNFRHSEDDTTLTRVRRSPNIRKSDSYTLNSNKENLTPLGQVAKMLMNSVKKLKGKKELPMWQDTVEKLRNNGLKRKKYKKLVEDDSEENLRQIQMNVFKEKLMGKPDLTADIDVDGMVQDPKKLEKFVKDRKKPKNKEERVIDLIRDGLKLAYTLAGQNTTGFDNKTMKIVSPRFLGLVPEEKDNDEISLISPSLFSLHDQGEGIENLTSLPNLLKNLGIKDQQLWLDIVMEAAGVNEESEKLADEVHDYEFNSTQTIMTNITHLRDKDGTPLYATKENVTEMGASPEYIEMFENLQQNYTKNQLREMNTTGFAVLNKHQIKMLYGPSAPFPNLPVYNRLINMTEEEIRDQMFKEFNTMSQMKNFRIDQHQIQKSQEEHARRKRQLLPGVVLSPVVATPVVGLPLLASEPFILSPIVLTPLILSPSVFGAIILSPWLFVPVIISPRILGTLILSPFAFSPIVLSPFVLHPAILSPGIFSPIVLSPLLLLPLILSPQAFTPIILSPLCLSPVILNPMVGSPLILSPFVLSPIIGSPMILSGLILSPYALSPVLFSPLIAFIAVLSPSWLS
ncbi:unnamed protein product [Bursaphelenchus okinawaensis]|uniref:Uncharacterized protein n=1 Tax=Bursaphelenchus okinawaensis TaxID=465554 RepID=A0A811K3V8_9BILA|nr:unnamed protein product [Bursaphelenchus okinawaensis]CAG9091717.1 unnamed protein product [Bursaphelenchus okinawaensis]